MKVNCLRLCRASFKDFDFHGFVGKRRVVSFSTVVGCRDRRDAAISVTVRERAAAFVGIEAADLQHALLTEYRHGTAIGWHRYRSVFGEVIGISLLAPCTFRLRSFPFAYTRFSEARSLGLVKRQHLGSAIKFLESGGFACDDVRHRMASCRFRGHRNHNRQEGAPP